MVGVTGILRYATAARSQQRHYKGALLQALNRSASVRIGQTDDPHCLSCGEEEDLSHVFNHCRLYQLDRTTLLDDTDFRHQGPTNRLKKILKFIEKNNISLGNILPDHPLDTGVHDYFKVIDEILIPDAMALTPDLPEYSKRIRSIISVNHRLCKIVHKRTVHRYLQRTNHRVIKYTNPAFNVCWNFGVELVYRKVAPPEHQTKENLTLARLLRALLDLTCTYGIMLDDIMDKAEERMGKPVWHTFCSGGTPCALYDASVLGYVPFHILTKRFRQHPAYIRFMQSFAEDNMKMMIGETLDMLGQGVSSPFDSAREADIVKYKTGVYFRRMPLLALPLADFEDENDIMTASEIFLEAGRMSQVWDDFADYYNGHLATGKPSCDIRNGGTTWLSVAAAKHFTPDQMEIFKSCYGTGRPEDEARVRKLYDDIKMPELYVERLRDCYQEEIRPRLDSLRDPRVRDACHSYIDWMISDLMD